MISWVGVFFVLVEQPHTCCANESPTKRKGLLDPGFSYFVQSPTTIVEAWFLCLGIVHTVFLFLVLLVGIWFLCFSGGIVQ